MDTNNEFPSFNSLQDVLDFIGTTEEELAKLPPADDEDVARNSLQALLDDGSALSKARLSSSGMIRLTGEGVKGHSANLANTGILMTAWQKLVTSVAAAKHGYKSLRGTVKKNIADATALNLTAGFQPGSVIIPISPAANKVEELFPQGEPLVDSQPRTTIDQAMEETINLLAQAPECSQDELIELLQPHGPRVAATLRNTLRNLADSNYNLETNWREPGQRTVKAKMTAAQAAEVTNLIESKKLDADEVDICGRVRTVSDLSSLVVATGENELEENLRIDRGQLTQEELEELKISMIIKIRCQMEEFHRPGGNVEYRYTALRLLQADSKQDSGKAEQA